MAHRVHLAPSPFSFEENQDGGIAPTRQGVATCEVIVMGKSARRRTDEAVATAAARESLRVIMKSIEDMFNRLRAEYLEMPGLRLTAAQVQRLCGIERMMCQSVLDALVDAKFLCMKSDGSYTRVTGGEIASHARSAKAELGTPTPTNPTGGGLYLSLERLRAARSRRRAL
jgi:hypothetical protein